MCIMGPFRWSNKNLDNGLIGLLYQISHTSCVLLNLRLYEVGNFLNFGGFQPQ